MSQDLASVAGALVADAKEILAADDTVPTLTKRFDELDIQSTEQSRRQALDFEIPVLDQTRGSWRRCADTYLDPPDDICGGSKPRTCRG